MRDTNLLAFWRHRARILIRYSRRPTRYRQVLLAVERLQPRSILEVGVYQGRRGMEMIEAAKLSRDSHEIEYFGFDFFEEMNDEIMRHELSKWPGTREKVAVRLARTGANIELHAGPTQRTLPAFLLAKPERTIDFIFIDGGHAIDTIRSDWSYLARLMHAETTVLFDDYYINCPHLTDKFGCNRVMDELDEDEFEWCVLTDIDRFVHKGNAHNVAMTEVRRRKAIR